jgi:hypothetical protein
VSDDYEIFWLQESGILQMGLEEGHVVFWTPVRTILMRCSYIYGEHLQGKDGIRIKGKE